MKAFENALELSSCAAALVGPNTRKPCARNSSTMPAASGCSGPTTVSAIFSRAAQASSAWTSVILIFSSRGSSAVPPLPGATNTACTLGDCDSFHASACSRPPPPTTRTFMRQFPFLGFLFGVGCSFFNIQSCVSPKARRCETRFVYRRGLPAHPTVFAFWPRHCPPCRWCCRPAS